jgi:hypothetical protein
VTRDPGATESEDGGGRRERRGDDAEREAKTANVEKTGFALASGFIEIITTFFSSC